MYTYRSFISRLCWLIVGILWLPMNLLAQSGLVPTEAGKRADTLRMGMGVFGNVLGIHGTDTLALQGDLVLVEAEVVGEGTLSLCARQPQQIIARNSSVQNLHVANPTKVTVQGDLTIKKNLTVEKGVFDSRMANLVLADTCRLRVVKGGQILWQENQLLVKQAKTIPQPRPDLTTTWANVWQEITLWKKGRFLTTLWLDYQSFIWLKKDTIPPFPPPKSRNRAT